MLLYLFCNKSHYENVPFEIPESWCWTTIDELLINRDSERVPLSSTIRKKQVNKVYDYYGAAGVIDKVEGYLFNEKLLLIGEDGANLLSRSKDNAFFADGKYWVNNHAHVLDCCYKSILTYVAYLINSISLEPYVTGTAQPKLSQDNLNKIPIALPPIKEQARIVAGIEKWVGFIDEIEAGKIELESYIKQTKSKILDLAISGKLVPQDPNDEPAIELLKRINPDFEPCDNSHYENLPENWCLAKVKDVFVINPRNKAEDNTIAGFIPMTLIDDGYSNTFSYEKREWGSIKTGFTHFADGDVAVAKISPCLENRKSIVLRDLPNGIGAGTTELHVFRSSVVVPEYALYFFKSEYFISKCVGTFNGVVGQQRVGKNIIEETQIRIPPINEQTKIVSTIETIFTQLNTITAEL